MKADFEKGTKICCRCKKELPLDMFYKDKSRNDGLCCCCKNCKSKVSCEEETIYRKDIEEDDDFI